MANLITQCDANVTGSMTISGGPTDDALRSALIHVAERLSEESGIDDVLMLTIVMTLMAGSARRTTIMSAMVNRRSPTVLLTRDSTLSGYFRAEFPAASARRVLTAPAHISLGFKGDGDLSMTGNHSFTIALELQGSLTLNVYPLEERFQRSTMVRFHAMLVTLVRNYVDGKEFDT